MCLAIRIDLTIFVIGVAFANNMNSLNTKPLTIPLPDIILHPPIRNLTNKYEKFVKFVTNVSQVIESPSSMDSTI